jgi:catechol 2,3-dioxygenase-like lactoylglutathione lyase family enzyme
VDLPARLSFVTLGVSDLGRAIAFYEALGWPRTVHDADGVAFFRLGGDVVLSLFPYEELVADARIEGGPPKPPFPGISLAVNVDSEEAVDTALAAAEAAGARILKPGTRAEWGGYTAYFADPDGHPWEVAWNPQYPDGFS